MSQAQLQQLSFGERTVTHERTHTFTGIVDTTEAYTTKDNTPGVRIWLKDAPYPFSLLKGSLKGRTAHTLVGCTVKLDGELREYNGKQYLNARDLTVIEESQAAKAAKAGLIVSITL